MNDQVNQHNGICMKRKAFALVNKVCTFVFLTLLFVHLATSDLRAQSSVDTQAPKLDTNLTDAEFKALRPGQPLQPGAERRTGARCFDCGIRRPARGTGGAFRRDVDHDPEYGRSPDN